MVRDGLAVARRAGSRSRRRARRRVGRLSSQSRGGSRSHPGAAPRIREEGSPIVSLGMALKALTQNRLRALLTLSGMSVGVAMVVIVSGLGRGAQLTIEQQIESAGSDADHHPLGQLPARRRSPPPVIRTRAEANRQKVSFRKTSSGIPPAIPSPTKRWSAFARSRHVRRTTRRLLRPE